MRVHGVKYFAGRFEDAVALVVARAEARTGGYACLAGAHLVFEARRNAAVADALEGSWMNFPDGKPIAWKQRAAVPDAERIAGPDLMPAVIDAGREAGLRHFFLGATDELLERVAAAVAARFPGVAIAGMASLPFGVQTACDAAAVATAISETEPDIVWLALGAPKQELWASSNAHLMSPALVMAVGAAFEFLAGTRRRAPVWMQRLGLEWFYRLCQEPRRLGRRYFAANSAFLWNEFVTRIGA